MKKVCYIPYDPTIELNDKAFSKDNKYRWTYILKDILNKNGYEIHTYDILPPEKADEIICFDNVYFQNNRFFKRILDCGKLGNTIHIDFEPPSGNCRIHDDNGLKLLSNLFKSLITYNDNVINNNTIIKGIITDFYQKEIKYNDDFKDRKLVTIVANYRGDKQQLFGKYPGSLYDERLNAVAYFQEKCPNDFDLYGNYWENEYKKCYKKSLKREEKMSTLNKYKFVISYDSLTNQNGYISEKIFDCFKAKVVPIYWGADNVTDYIPKECFIDKRDFDTYDELYDFISKMDQKEYNEYIKNIEKYLKSAKYKNTFSSNASAKIIYNEIIKSKRNININKAKKIINHFEKLRTNDYRYNGSLFYYDYNFPKHVSFVSCNMTYTNGDYSEYTFDFSLNANKKHKFDIYYKKKNKYHKIPYEKKLCEYEWIDNEKIKIYKYDFQIDTKIIKSSKIPLYIYDINKKKYYPLTIVVEFNINDIPNHPVKISKNNFIFRKSFKRILKEYIQKIKK